MSFDTLGLLPALLKSIQEEGYTEATSVQLQAIPLALKGHDVLAGARTGTGKTAAFTLPVLQRLFEKENVSRKPRALILTPTRELAMQVEESVRTYGRYLNVRSATIFGGVNMNRQILQLRAGVDIIVATPGRLMDHMRQKTVDLSRIEILVLDEADRMLDMGFIVDIEHIMTLIPNNRQNLLFSATFSPEIKKLASGFMRSPILIEASPQNTAATPITQKVHWVDKKRKRELISFLIGSKNWKQVLIFIRTKHSANKLAEQLEMDGLTAAAIHGNKSQGARVKALHDFKQGKIRILVATDIAARGIDIEELPHVVNYDLPNLPEDYVHRIGRTGRAGNEGEALSLVCAEESAYLKGIERLLKCTIPVIETPGFKFTESIQDSTQLGRHGMPARSHGSSQGGNRQGQAPRQGAPRQGGQGSRNGRPPAAGGGYGSDSRGGRPSSSAPQRGGDRRHQQQGRGGK